MAALVGAGMKPAALEDALAALDFRSLTAAPRRALRLPVLTRALLRLPLGQQLKTLAAIWTYGGVYSSEPIEEWMNRTLRETTGIKDRNVRFRDLPTPTWIVAADLATHDVKVWSTWETPEIEVAYAVRCSCSIPGYFQPVDDRFVDGGVLSNLPAFVFHQVRAAAHNPLATRTLGFTLVADSGSAIPLGTAQAARALVNTVVDGAVNVQQRMSEVHIVAIPTGGINATDFDSMDSASIATLVTNGRQAAAAFFDDELARVRSGSMRTNLLTGTDEVYAAVTERLDDSQVRKIWIVQPTTRWLYALFPSLLYWLLSNVDVTVVWRRLDAVDSHESYRRRLLRVLGVRVVEVEETPFKGFLFDPRDAVRGTAIITAPSLVDNGDVRAMRYAAPFDSAAIDALAGQAEQTLGLASVQEAGALPKLISTTPDDLIARLHKYVPPYGQDGVQLRLRQVRVKDIISLSKVVKAFKYKQIGFLRRLFETAGMQPFQLACVKYSDGSTTIITPVVAEHSGGSLVLIQGNTRALYSCRASLEEIDCVVAENVPIPLPSMQRIAVGQMLIGDRTISTHERYGADIDRDYRQVEFAAHHPDITVRPR